MRRMSTPKHMNGTERPATTIEDFCKRGNLVVFFFSMFATVFLGCAKIPTFSSVYICNVCVRLALVIHSAGACALADSRALVT
jgi:hypothetical protein